MKKISIYIIVIILLSACSPSPEAIQQAISQTQTAAPTPTKIPFSQIPLKDLIFQEGDLPAGYSPAQIRSELGDFTDNAVTPDNFISYSLSHNGSMGGLVDVLVYNDISNVKPAFTEASSHFPGTKKSVDVGETGVYAVNMLIINTVSVAFYRCHSVVALQFQGTFIAEDVISYANHLDERLQQEFCD